jgi:capsular polysaccharide export protein
MAAASLLAIPPFPGAKPPRFAELRSDGAEIADADTLAAALATHRVGGCYWGRQRPFPASPFVLDGTGARDSEGVIAWATDEDPWHLLPHAAGVRLHEGDPRTLLAFAAAIPVTLRAADGSERTASDEDAARWLSAWLTAWRYTDPFTGTPLAPIEAIELCGFWRRLIDGNRPIRSVLGIAYWKKPTVTALLWGGDPVPYDRAIGDPPELAAIWRTRMTGGQAQRIAKGDVPVAEIEDGFIRSQGLGADCVPPLSIIFDARGPHFAPGTASELELMLQNGEFPPELLERARNLRAAIIAAGLSKYEAGGVAALPRPGGERRHVLVTGQVEDDRAVTSGGAITSNLELLRRARECAGPDAFLIYKPHPDVLAGHRRGAIPAADMARLADQIETAQPMAALIAMVDELHVNTSLAGFEALMRGKPVTVHGVPFYAGWGLTTDLGPIPARRTARRTLDELVAAALLLYPRYLDPVTGLPCPAEVLVERLSRTGTPQLNLRQRAIIAARRLQGRVRMKIAASAGAADSDKTTIR